jgi:hypothetical protein
MFIVYGYVVDYKSLEELRVFISGYTHTLNKGRLLRKSYKSIILVNFSSQLNKKVAKACKFIRKSLGMGSKCFNLL